MAHKRSYWFWKAIAVGLVFPLLQAVGCFSDEDIRTVIRDMVTVSLDATKVGINNWIDQTLPTTE